MREQMGSCGIVCLGHSPVRIEILLVPEGATIKMVELPGCWFNEVDVVVAFGIFRMNLELLMICVCVQSVRGGEFSDEINCKCSVTHDRISIPNSNQTARRHA